MNFIVFKTNDSTVSTPCDICSSIYRTLVYKITKNTNVLKYELCPVNALKNKFDIFIKCSNNTIVLHRHFMQCIYYLIPSYNIYKLIL